MGLYNRFIRFSLIIPIVFFTPIMAFASDTADISFEANISDGSCDITLSDTMLSYGVHRATDIEPSSTAAVLPLIVNVLCNANNTPSLSVNGNVYVPSSINQNVIFRDADSGASGVGFMIRRDVGGINNNNFYNTELALKKKEPVSLNAVLGNVSHSEPLQIGLVRAGSESVTPGLIKAVITLRVDYE